MTKKLTLFVATDFKERSNHLDPAQPVVHCSPEICAVVPSWPAWQGWRVPSGMYPDAGCDGPTDGHSRHPHYWGDPLPGSVQGVCPELLPLLRPRTLTSLTKPLGWGRSRTPETASLQSLLSAAWLGWQWGWQGKSWAVMWKGDKHGNKYNFFSSLLARIELFPPVPVERQRFVHAIVIWFCPGTGQGCLHSELRENIRSQNTSPHHLLLIIS